jgi:hypothetical protein
MTDEQITIPREWTLEAERLFEQFKNKDNCITQQELKLFINEHLKTCPKAMSETQPPISDFFERFALNQNDRLNLTEFTNLFYELCLVKIDFLKEEN